MKWSNWKASFKSQESLARRHREGREEGTNSLKIFPIHSGCWLGEGEVPSLLVCPHSYYKRYRSNSEDNLSYWRNGYLSSVLWNHLIHCRKDLVLDKAPGRMDWWWTDEQRTEKCDRRVSCCSSLAWAQKSCLVLGSWHVDGQNGVTERSWWVGLQRKVCGTELFKGQHISRKVGNTVTGKTWAGLGFHWQTKVCYGSWELEKLLSESLTVRELLVV